MLRMNFVGKLPFVLGLMAVLVVAAYVLNTPTAHRPAFAATGSVFVANEGSKTTNENPSPTGYTPAATVTGNFDDGGGAIPTDSDLIRIVALDAGLLAPQSVTSAVEVNSTGDSIVSGAAGGVFTLKLTGSAGKPIAGSLDDVRQNTTIESFEPGVGLVEFNVDRGGSALKITSFLSGSDSEDAIIVVQLLTSGSFDVFMVTYETVIPELSVASVRSEIDLAGTLIFLEETGPNTGRFEGFVRLVGHSQTSTWGTVGTIDGVIESSTAGTIRTDHGIVEVEFVDSDGVTRQTQVQVTNGTPPQPASIFVANEFTHLTNESPPPIGYSVTSSVTGTVEDGRGIPLNSDMIKVVIEDEGVSSLTPVTTTGIVITDGGTGNMITAGIGSTALITLPGMEALPITGDLDHVEANTSIITLEEGDLLAGSRLSVVGFFRGDENNSPWIRVAVTIPPSGPSFRYAITEITFDTDAFDTVEAKATSGLVPGGVTFAARAEETGANRFVGYVRLVPLGVTGPVPALPVGISTGSAALLQTGIAPVTFEYVDIGGETRQTQAEVVEHIVPPESELYVANEWSKQTDELPTPAGYSFASTIHGTFDDGGGSIPTDSDLIKVIVEDDAARALTPVQVTGGGVAVTTGGDGGSGITATAGATIFIALQGQVGVPIAGDLTHVQANTSIVSAETGEIADFELTITDFFAGDDTNPPWLEAIVNVSPSGPSFQYTITEITYNTAPQSIVSLNASSSLIPGGVTVAAQEEGFGTGRFIGFVRLVASGVTAPAPAGDPGLTPATAALLQTDLSPVTFEYQDPAGPILQTQVEVTNAIQSPSQRLFATNEWSLWTTDPSPPFGHTSTEDLYATYPETGRLIQPNADLIRVIVRDAGFDTISDVTSAVEVSPGGSNIVSGDAFQSFVLTLPGSGDNTIAGDLATVQQNISIQTFTPTPTELNAGNGGSALTITNFFPGSELGDGFLSVLLQESGTFEIDQVTYQTSSVESVVATASSVIDPTGVSVFLEETGFSTGRFEGFLRLDDPTAVSTDGSIQNLDGAPEVPGAAVLRVDDGPVVVNITDSDGLEREVLVHIDTTPPENTPTAPADGSATQNNVPAFGGTVTDSGSGIAIGSVLVAVDPRDDPSNAAPAADTLTGELVAGVWTLSISTAGALDGDNSFSFTQTPGGPIPTGVPNPDHIVDWAIIASDVAGNLAISDVDPATAGVQLPTVRIDRIIPHFIGGPNDNTTGLSWDGEKEVWSRQSIRVAFAEDLTNVQASDFLIALDSGETVAPTSIVLLNDLEDSDGVPFNHLCCGTPPAEYLRGVHQTVESLVYLELPVDIGYSETPSVVLVDYIQDLAGNSTQFGSVEIGDGLFEQSACPVNAYDTDHDDLIDRDEALQAVSDFLLGHVGAFNILLTRSEALDIVAAHLLGLPAECSS